MTKEKILEAFDEKFGVFLCVRTGLHTIIEYTYDSRDLKSFISTSIDSLLQEDDLPKELKTNLNNLSLQGRLYAKAFDSGFSSCLSQVKEIIKSKIK